MVAEGASSLIALSVFVVLAEKACPTMADGWGQANHCGPCPESWETAELRGPNQAKGYRVSVVEC